MAFSFSAASAAGPDSMAIAASTETSNGAAKPLKLQGRAEVQDARLEPRRDPRLEAWHADMNYRRGAMALSANDYKAAAEFFKQSADGYESAIGPSKFVGDARFAQAQACRLAKLDSEAERLFKVAVDLFRKYDPGNPYLRAGQGYLDELGKAKLKAKVATTQLKGQTSTNELKAEASIPKLQPPMEGRIDSVDRHVTLQGKTMQLAGSLKDEDLFNGAKLQAEAATADLSEKYVKDRIYKGFVKMTCLEFAALGGNYYTAPDNYKTFTSDEGKPVIIGATDDNWNQATYPAIRLKLNQKDYNVSMFLPGLAKSSRNVMVITDDRHVLAIDPRKDDVWKLVPVFNKNGTADFNWWKLTHTKRNNVPSCTTKPPASPFARAKAAK
jgi:hypothetical protein